MIALGIATTADRAEGNPDGSAVAPDTVTGELTPKNDSGISGMAQLVHGDSLLHVGLTTTGLEAGEEYPAHVHQGTYESGGGVVTGVGPVTKPSAEHEVGEATAATRTGRSEART